MAFLFYSSDNLHRATTFGWAVTFGGTVTFGIQKESEKLTLLSGSRYVPGGRYYRNSMVLKGAVIQTKRRPLEPSLSTLGLQISRK